MKGIEGNLLGKGSSRDKGDEDTESGIPRPVTPQLLTILVIPIPVQRFCSNVGNLRLFDDTTAVARYP